MSIGLHPTTRLGAIESRRIVVDCVEYVDAIRRIPSIAELRGVAHVSERRLRGAFTETYGTPPRSYFTEWALHEAKEQLSLGWQGALTVSDVAYSLGFGNLGRFAVKYRHLHDELPSATLKGM